MADFVSRDPRKNVVVVLDVPITRSPLDEVVQFAVQRIERREKTLYSAANAHSIVMAHRLPAFLDHFQTADVVLPDGILPVLVSRWVPGGAIPRRISGGLFFYAFADVANKLGLRLFFLGSTPSALARIERNVVARWPNIRVVGTASPPFRPLMPQDHEVLCRQVNEAAPDALFVGMTAPKQELFLSRNFERLRCPFMMGIGAVFDYLSGEKTRPPDWLGQIGLEWLFRLVREPRRLFRRNLDSVIFLQMSLWWWVKRAYAAGKPGYSTRRPTTST